jgi:mRNA interferase YafQ
MYKVVYTSRMKRDVKLMKKQQKDMSKLRKVLGILASGEKLPPEYRDHELSGNLKDFRECHIEGDWLLLYQIFESKLILSAAATGSHERALRNI